MTIQQLHFVTALIHRGSFSGAAEDCFVTQPTLSSGIKKLEDELGVMLFDRTSQPVQPTQAGKAVADQAREIMKSLEDLRQSIQNEQANLEGQVSLGIIPTLAPYLLPEFLPGFTREYPGIRFHIRELISREILTGVGDHSLDFGIMASPGQGPGLEEHHLFFEPFVAYLPPGHELLGRGALAARDLETRGLLLLDEGHCLRSQILTICSAQGRSNHPGHHFQSGSLETLKQLVDAGLGYTLLPQLALGQLSEQQRRRVVAFRSPRPARELCLVSRRGYPRTRLLRSLVEHLGRVFPQEVVNRWGDRNPTQLPPPVLRPIPWQPR